MPYYRKLPSGKWQATVRHPSGDRFTRTDPLKRVVVEWATDLEQQLRRGPYVDPHAGRITLAAWWDRWSETRVAEQATIDKRESLWRVHLKPAFATWPIESIQVLDVEAWVADLARREVGKEAAASAFRLLKQLLGEAAKNHKIRANPCDLVSTPSAPRHIDRFLSLAEADRLLAAVTMVGDRTGTRRDQPAPRVPDEVNRLFVRLMLEAGLRWEEAAGLHGHRVDLMRRRLLVREVVIRGRKVKPIPKSDAGQRVVPLIDGLVADLSAHMAGRDRSDLLFPGPGGHPLDYSNWRKRVWQTALAAAKLDDPQPTPHDSRHSYGSWLAEQGVPPTEIRDLMGHGSLRAVERYLHSSEVRLERARRALDARVTHEPPETKQTPSPRSAETGSDLR